MSASMGPGFPSDDHCRQRQGDDARGDGERGNRYDNEYKGAHRNTDDHRHDCEDRQRNRTQACLPHVLRQRSGRMIRLARGSLGRRPQEW